MATTPERELSGAILLTPCPVAVPLDVRSEEVPRRRSIQMATKQQSTRRDPQSVDTDGSIPGSGEFLGLDNEAFHYVLASPVGEYGGTAVDYANKGYEPVERGGDIKTRSEALFGVSSRSESRFVTERGMVLMRIPREMKEAMDAEERAYAQQVRKQHDNVPSLVGPVNSRGISIS